MSISGETAPLPRWDGMSDLDKGAALMHLHKREYEGAEYAVEKYPARYFEHPGLAALDWRRASEHAASLIDDAEALAPEEHERLYNAALDADDTRWHAEHQADAAGGES
jgi:hypothetical protein